MHTADSFDKMRSGLTLRSANFSRRGCISPISWLPERVSRNLIEINMHFRVHHNYCTFICVGMAEAISQSPSFILSLSYLFVKVSQSGLGLLLPMMMMMMMSSRMFSSRGLCTAFFQSLSLSSIYHSLLHGWSLLLNLTVGLNLVGFSIK